MPKKLGLVGIGYHDMCINFVSDQIDQEVLISPEVSVHGA
jgi:hypothetical protein